MIKVEVINEVILNNGIKKTWIAKRLGVHYGTLAKCLNGRQQMPIDLGIKIGLLLDISPKALYSPDLYTTMRNVNVQ